MKDISVCGTNVSRTFNLLNRPCVAEVKGLRDRDVASGKDIQNLMETVRINAVRKFLCSFYIRDFKECIIPHLVNNLLFIKFMSKEVMAVHIKLKLERRPRRNAEVAKPKFFINEIEVIMQTFTLVKFQKRFSACFVVPRLVSITAFHNGENMDQTF